MEKLQELNSPAFRAAKLHARPEVTADPRMDPNYESDGNEDKSKDKMMMMGTCCRMLCFVSVNMSVLFIYIF